MKKEKRITFFTFFGFVINLFFSFGNAFIGIIKASQYFIVLSAYYIIISVMRFTVIVYKKKSVDNSFENEMFVKIFSGYMFFLLAIILIAVTYLTVTQSISNKYCENIMITIATYTFAKVCIAIINLIKSKKSGSPVLTTLRSISFADATVSLFSLQRSMLVSFNGIKNSDIYIFNALMGSSVCVLVIILGINLIKKEDKTKWRNSGRS